MREVMAARRRRWADVVVMVVGLWVTGWAFWTPMVPPPEHEAVRDFGAFWAVTAVAGLVAVASVPVTFLSTAIARAMLVVAALVLLVGVFVFEGLTTTAVTRVIVPALVLLAAAPFIGPMPTPEEEGRTRTPRL